MCVGASQAASTVEVILVGLHREAKAPRPRPRLGANQL